MPDPSESTTLIGLTDKMTAIEATQLAQEAEIAELRKRSEVIVRAWYQNGVVDNSKTLADVESRVRGVERHVRRRERVKEEEKAL